MPFDKDPWTNRRTPWFGLGMLPTQQKSNVSLRSTSGRNIEQSERFGLNLTAKLQAEGLGRCKEWLSLIPYSDVERIKVMVRILTETSSMLTKMLHVHIIILHVYINKKHVNIFMLHLKCLVWDMSLVSKVT